MSLHRLMVHDVTVVRPAVVADRYGNEAKDWATATRTPVKGWVARRTQDEIVGNREAQVSEWVAYLPADTAIAGGDRVEALDATFEVDGPPNPAHSPRGLHHIEAQLRAVEG